ncbi:MAG: hypothetical protein EOO61_21725 [Hymenobacter sp.]|nr:MAG: hypothetical protein EOO61_21725 [Hymenobacter sp.]
MKANSFLRMFTLGGLVPVLASCQQEQAQQAKPIPKVTDITSSTIKVQHDTAAFNKVMNSPTAPDSVPNTKK